MYKKQNKKTDPKRQRKTEIFLKSESEEALTFFRAEQSKGHAPEETRTKHLIKIDYWLKKPSIEDLFKN